MITLITNPANRAVREFFEAHNITGADAAKALRLSESLVSLVINGKKRVTPNFYFRFQCAYCYSSAPRFLPDAINVATVISNDLFPESKPEIIEAHL